jgi:hypothetical protein
MSVNPTISKGMNHSIYELRFLKLEAGLKKHEELSKTVENLTKQFVEMKTQLVRTSSVLTDDYIFLK